VFSYSERRFLSPWIDDLLTKRQASKVKPNSDLTRNVLKLVLNGFYGYTGLQANNFTKTTLLSEV
jgi:hypothetical protein